MKYPRQIYAIYPYDQNKELAGVYIGSSFYLPTRFKNHLSTTANDPQPELHELMRQNGFAFQILGKIEGIKQNDLEYAWEDFFRKAGVKVFNSLQVKERNWKEYLIDFSRPVWNGKGVTWEMSPTFSKAEQ